MLETLTVADFVPCLNQIFRLAPPQPFGQSLAAEPRLLELVEATEIGQPPAAGAASTWRRPFSLIFAESTSNYLPQQIYTLEHESLGRLDLFLVPLGPQDGRMRYQAIFS